MDKLNTGVELCRLQNKLTAMLGGEKIEYHADAEKYSQFTRQIIEHFINWCKGLDCHQRFESNDLVDQKSEQKEINEQRRKRVVVCLHQIKQKYDRALRSKKEPKVNKGEEDGRVKTKSTPVIQ